MKKACDNAVPYLDPYVLKQDRGAPWLDCRDNYEWYYTYGHEFKPQRILEVGVRFGYSVLAMMFGANGCTEHVSLYDNEQEEPGSLNVANDLINKAFPDVVVSIHKTDTQIYDPAHGEGPFDLIHIDADHRPEAVRHDITVFWSLLRSSGVMILDDMMSIDGENACPLFFHLMPWLFDHNAVAQVMFIKNYNGHLLVWKA